jgi:signal peptidase I
VASPEFPDDRRAEPRRFGPAESEPVTRPFARPVEPLRSDDDPAGRWRRPDDPPDERRTSNHRAAETSGRPSRARKPGFWRELPALVVVALVLTFLIQTFLAKVYVIPSGSMETTLHGCSGCTNDRVLVDKITYRFGDPRPGDVVVFRGPDGWRNTEFTVEETANPVQRVLQGLGSLVGLAPPDEKDFVKRVIATGGQTVACCDPGNRVLVDGRALDEPYIYYLPEAGPLQQAPFGPVTVPAGELWMMGDSRNNSADSRVPGHGAVPVANVIGQARVILMPFARFGTISSVDPQTSALGMGSADAGWGALMALPAVVALRRRGGVYLAPSVRRRRRT